jgi:hypothetical protein
VTKAGARFGFLGLLSPATKHKTSAPNEKLESLTYVIEDPVATARTVVPELRAACDVTVVLAHMDETEARRLLEAVPGIDLVVLGHDPSGKPLGPETVAGARVVRATAQGQYIGELSIALGPDHGLADARNRVHVLDASYQDDADMVKRVEEFDRENRQLQKELYARQQLEGDDGDPFDSRYLGVGACQSCHVEEFDVYVKTAHARAYATLASQFVHRDTNCVGCHVTGFGDVGGFGGVRLRGASVDLIDVQCEACHGPGSEHARDGSYRASAIASCVRCHTHNDDPDFDFAVDWPKVAH